MMVVWAMMYAMFRLLWREKMMLLGQPNLDLLFNTPHFTPVESSELSPRSLTTDLCSSDSASLITMRSLNKAVPLLHRF